MKPSGGSGGFEVFRLPDAQSVRGMKLSYLWHGPPGHATHPPLTGGTPQPRPPEVNDPSAEGALQAQRMSMDERVKSDPQSRRNADHLDSVLASNREDLSELGGGDARARHEQAIEQMANYVSMLRDTTTTSASLAAAYGPDGRPRRPFSFKLEFADGRWDVDEKELDTAPKIGDIVSFGDGRPWRIRASQFVRARPTRKPMREFFVCAPVA